MRKERSLNCSGLGSLDVPSVKCFFFIHEDVSFFEIQAHELMLITRVFQKVSSSSFFVVFLFNPLIKRVQRTMQGHLQGCREVLETCTQETQSENRKRKKQCPCYPTRR